MRESMAFECMDSVIAFFLIFFAGNVVILSSNACMYPYVLLLCAFFAGDRFPQAGDLLFQSNPTLFAR
jgi:hypothetical protein